ncbi:hypothetical protein ABZW11_16950 [Nonomuraea sp. NPDC004580]|uniref:hypothetical protein n=1 Tax=Nonomuraea sp. NPDC004580 TaxID=3154552 RepID=UPI0033A1008A
MTPILAPATTTNTSTADQIIEALASYHDEHAMALGGDHQRTMLLAALIVRLFDTPASQAIDLARNDAFDDRVRAASDALTEALDRARRTRLALESWTPRVGDRVTHTGTDGTWIITAFEDDDTAWIARPDAPTSPTIGRATDGLTNLTGWDTRPDHELLAVVDQLRPAQSEQTSEGESPAAHYARTGHLPGFGCCITIAPEVTV